MTRYLSVNRLPSGSDTVSPKNKPPSSIYATFSPTKTHFLQSGTGYVTKLPAANSKINNLFPPKRR